MIPAGLMLRLLNRREFTLMFLACCLIGVFTGLLLLFSWLVWVVFILSVIGALIFGYKAFFAKRVNEVGGLEKAFLNADLGGILGQNGKGNKKKP